MRRIIILLGFSAALAYAACAHYPEGDDSPPSDGGGSCGTCPDGQTCVDGTCTTPPDGGGGPDGGTCTDPNGCPPDGGNGGGSDGGTGGGSDGGTGGGSDGGGGGGSDGGTCGVCPPGEVCVDGQCVCDGGDGGGDDGHCRAGKTLLCHYPPGNPANHHTICVGDSAVPAHLAHHDTLGLCP